MDDQAPARKPFHWVLKAGLLGSLAFFASIYMLPSAPAVLFLVAGIAVALQIVSVPTALYLLIRGGYRTPGNIVITLLGLLPLFFVAMAVVSVMFGHVHM